MKKRIITALLLMSLLLLLVPVTSRAAITPDFVAVNDTLLPFNESTMPYIVGGDIFVPVTVFESLKMNLWSVVSSNGERALLFRGVDRYLDFYTARRVTEDQDGNTMPWPSARLANRRVYVPLKQVCEYLGLRYSVLSVSRNVIAAEQIWLIRIVSDSVINDPTFMGMNSTTNQIRNAYNAYKTVSTTPPPQQPPPPQLPPDTVEEPDDFSDITIHISFFDISNENTDAIITYLDIQPDLGYYSAFFVNADEIAGNPGLVRRIAGSGHAIGIWLDEGTYEEYLTVSAWLFEAAKIRTVLVSADEAKENAVQMAESHGLIYWEGNEDAVREDDISLDDIIPMFPTESGSARSFLFPCSENMAYILPGVYNHLRTYEYALKRITETTEPTYELRVES